MNEDSRPIVGMDVSDVKTELRFADANGKILPKKHSLSTDPTVFAAYFEHQEAMRVVLEVGAHSHWIGRLLRGLGHEVWIVHPRQARAIASGLVDKDDDSDAKVLTQIGIMDPKAVRLVVHRSEEAQSELEIVRARDAFVRCRTLLINHVRGCVKPHGLRLPACDAGAFAGRVASLIPETLHVALNPVLERIQDLTDQIRDYERVFTKLGKEKYPETELLTQIPGVGPITGLTYFLTLENPRRFKSSRSVGSWLGLRPKRHQSGESDPQLRITKEGNPYLRRLLVQAAQYIMHRGPDSDLRRFGHRLACRGGKAAKKKAIIAVARKLAVLLHHLWITAEVYEPLRNAKKAPA